jgi:hypothetical protein
MVSKSIAVREWYADVPRKTYVPTTAGILSIVVFILGFGYWSNSALIAGAIITSGAFVTTGQNKIIQHLEGGVIREILVHEGDIVEQGQSLIQLDETGPKGGTGPDVAASYPRGGDGVPPGDGNTRRTASDLPTGLDGPAE